MLDAVSRIVGLLLPLVQKLTTGPGIVKTGSAASVALVRTISRPIQICVFLWRLKKACELVMHRFGLAFIILSAATMKPAMPSESSARDNVTQTTQNPGVTIGERSLPNIAIGIGGYFLQPNEVTNAASRSAVISARPIVSFRAEQKLPNFFYTDRWALESRIGVVFPEVSAEKMAKLAGLINFDLGYLISDRFVLSSGIGVNPTLSISSAANVDIGGEFVTPGGTAVSWLFTNGVGVVYWLDPRIRLDVGTSVVRLFDNVTRKFRYFVEVAYAF